MIGGWGRSDESRGQQTWERGRQSNQRTRWTKLCETEGSRRCDLSSKVSTVRRWDNRGQRTSYFGGERSYPPHVPDILGRSQLERGEEGREEGRDP